MLFRTKVAPANAGHRDTEVSYEKQASRDHSGLDECIGDLSIDFCPLLM
jgi:hypothetical protein